MHRRTCPGQVFTAGADYRLDELPIRVLVGALEELGQVLPPVRRFIVRPSTSYGPIGLCPG